MAGDVHDGLVACTAFRKIGDERVPVVVPRPVTLAFFRTFFQAVLNVVTGRVGSLGRGLPNGKTYHSGRVSPNFSRYQTAYSLNTGSREEFSGMVRPSPASVLL